MAQKKKVNPAANTSQTGDMIHEKLFYVYLTDAISFAHYSELVFTRNINTTLSARAAVINSALALESAANICLLSLRLTERLLEEFEKKLSTVDKFEFFLSQQRPNCVFDRGCLAVQQAQDLLQLRNDFVHPKYRKHPVKVTKNNTTGKLNYEMEVGYYPALKIQKSPRILDGKGAVLALTTTFAFCEQFFFNWCQWPPKATAKFLSPGYIGKAGDGLFNVSAEAGTIANAVKWWKVPAKWIAFDPSVK